MWPQGKALWAALAFALLFAEPGFAQAIDENLWATNGSVYSVVRDGGTIYIGGFFSYVGPATGAGVPLDAASGSLPPSFPKIVGSVYTVVSDGAGGWYIGGLLQSVGGVPRTAVAHLASDLSVAPWNPNFSGVVQALVVSGSTVYLGGTFNSVGGQTRNNVAAVDATTGAVTAWNPNVTGTVRALAVSGSTIYLGGTFSSVGGQTRNNLAAVDATTGAFTAWNPNATNQVLALAVSGTTVYAAGDFIAIGGQTRNRIAALDTTTGAPTAWNPNASSTVGTLAVSGSSVYAGGAFSTIGGQTRFNLAALDTMNGAATAWNPNVNGYVGAIMPSGSIVYVGGNFSSIGGQARNRIAAIDATSAAPTAWNPNAGNTVFALAVSGSTVYAGGSPGSYGGQVRNNIAALDATTGVATAWNPNAAGFVYALAVRDSTVYAGGSFISIGGQTRHYIAAIDATTGAPTAWNPNASNTVFSLAVSGTNVYAGGFFTSIGTQMRNHIAALDVTTGTATSWNPDANSNVEALVVSGSTVYAGGAFMTIGGQTRNRIAALDTTTGGATPWDPDANGNVHALALGGAVVYAGGDFQTIGGQPRSRIAALDTATAAATSWNPDARNPVRALAVSGSTIYAGGDFNATNAIGGKTCYFIGALDKTTGAATPWTANTNSAVLAIAAGHRTVYAGGNFSSISMLPQTYIAGIEAVPEVLAVQPVSGGNAGFLSVTVLGGNLRSGATARLSRSGQPNIVVSGVTVAPDGLSLTATFDLRGAALGLWNVVVVNPDAQTATLPNGFTIELDAARQLRVDVIGSALMRPNRRRAFDVVIQNLGNTDVLAVPLWIHRIPTDATVEPDFTLTPPPRYAGEPDWSQAPLTLTGPGGRYLPVVIPRVPPGITTRRLYLTVPNTVGSFQLAVAVTPTWADEATLHGCLTDAGVIQAPACMGAELTAVNAYLASTPGVTALSGIGLWSKVAWRCEGASSLPQALAKAEQVLDLMLQPLEQSPVPPRCSGVLPARWQDALAVTIVTSVDPNDKLGVRGFGSSQQLSGQQIIPYSIRFENLQTATAPAQDVLVDDQLDGLTMDLNTVSIDTIRFGNRRVAPPPGLANYTTDVDLRPQRNVIVRVSVSLDAATKMLRWSLASIDPATGQSPPDSVGFLPPNVTPPQGEGSVLFTVRPKAGLATGTAIRNRATIDFDGNAQQTPEWLNTLDNTPPASRVLPLGTNQDSVRFTVHWEALSSPLDLQDFSVYVAEDGGDYRPWRLNTHATADTFAGRGGHVYSFYSLAQDSSGNLEAVPMTPDAQTTSPTTSVESGRWTLALEGAHPNPASRGVRVWFTLPSREPATLEVLDLAGRRVLRREVGALGPGRHSVDLSASMRKPGLYFLRLAQSGRVLRARVAVIR